MIPIPIFFYSGLAANCPACHKPEHRVKTCAHCNYRYPAPAKALLYAGAGYVSMALAAWYPITQTLLSWQRCEILLKGCGPEDYTLTAIMGMLLSVIWPVTGLAAVLGKLAQLLFA